jgi:hypothetical protein
MNEPRKASDVLLELENKIDALLGIVRTQDLNLKLISNKLTELMAFYQKPSAPNIKIEAVNTANVPDSFKQPTQPEKNVNISSEFNLPLDESPKGFRRTSRPETYAGDEVRPNKPETPVEHKVPKINVPAKTTPKQTEEVPVATGNVVPVVQRVVDRNGKSVFLADVEIINLETNQTIHKVRTNGAGKWMSSLNVGNYRTILRKRDSVTKEKLEIIQDIQVDGTMSPLELKVLIMK